ncbi:MAG: nucleotidyltransferase domain-containing protein [Dermatophilaceae bacterium]
MSSSSMQFLLALDNAANWPKWVQDMRGPGPQAYAVLTLCRALHSVTEGRQISKKQAGAFTLGALHGRRINCLSVQQQRDFHAGYEHQAKDTHDLAQLKALDQP